MVRTGRPVKYHDEASRLEARRESKRKYNQSKRGKAAVLQRRAHLRKDQSAMRARLGETQYAVHLRSLQPLRYPADIVGFMTSKYSKRPLKRLPGFYQAFHYGPSYPGIVHWLKRNVEAADFEKSEELEIALDKRPWGTLIGLIDGYFLHKLLDNFNESYLKLKRRRDTTGVNQLTDSMITRLLTLDTDLKRYNSLWRNRETRYGPKTQLLLHLTRYWLYTEITLLRTDLYQRYHSILDTSIEEYRNGCRTWQSKWSTTSEYVVEMIRCIWENDPWASDTESLDSLSSASIADALDSDDSDSNGSSVFRIGKIIDEDLESEASLSEGDTEGEGGREAECLKLARAMVKENMQAGINPNGVDPYNRAKQKHY